MTHLAGDRMMTILLSRLNRAGVAEITLTRDLDVIEIVPRTPFWVRLVPRMLREGRRAQVQKARTAFQALLDDRQIEPLFHDRTYAQALAFRLGPLFTPEHSHIRLNPGRYQAVAQSAAADDLDMGAG